MTAVNELIYKVILSSKKEAKKEQEELKTLGYEIEKVNGTKYYMVTNPKTTKSIYIINYDNKVYLSGIDYYYKEKAWFSKRKLIEDIVKVDFQNYLNTLRVNPTKENDFKIAMSNLKNIKWNINYYKKNIAETQTLIEQLSANVTTYQKNLDSYEDKLKQFKKIHNLS